MKLKKFGSTEQRIYELVEPIVTGLGFVIWDVRYEKEGASWYLRIFIDSTERSIDINDCVAVTEPVSELLDERDPIAQSYILEVSSAGLEAELIRESHFDAALGSEVRIKSIRPLPDGSREAVGVLEDWNKDSVTLTIGGEKQTFELNALAFVKLYFDFDAAT